MNWLLFALMTVLSWGVYGVFLHTGSMNMGDPVNGRIKSFLIVGCAYFLVAILGPLIILTMKGANWSFPMKGTVWSLLAGVVGALGALFVLLAFGAKASPLLGKGTPAAVMSIVFAGAPIINALVAISLHPPQGGVRWQFVLGIFLAAVGGCLVTFYKPNPAPPKQGPPAGPVEAAERRALKYGPPEYRVT